MLTLEQFKQLKAKGLTTEQIAKFEGGYKPEKTGLIENIKSDLSKRGTSIKESFLKKGDITKPVQSLEETINIAGQSIGGVYDVVNNVISHIGKPLFDKGTTELSRHISGTPTKIEQNINQTSKDVITSEGAQAVFGAINEVVKNNPRLARDVENLFNVISVIPFGKLASTTAKGTVGLVKNQAENLVNATGKVLQPALNKAGDALDAGGKILTKAAIPLGKPESKIVQAYKAKNPLSKRIAGEAIPEPRTAAITAYEKGFAGTESMIGIQAKREADKMWSEIVKPALGNIKEKIKTSEVFDNVLNRIIKDVKAPGRQNDLVDALEAMADDFKGIKAMTHQFAQDIKSDLYKFIPDKVWKGKPVASSLREVQAMFAQELRNMTRKALGNNKNVLDAFDDYGNMKALMEFGQAAMTGSKFKGGAGSWLNAAKEKLLVPLETVGGQILKKAGKVLKKDNPTMGKIALLKNTSDEIKNFQRNFSLNKLDSAIQEKAIEKFVKNKELLVDEYINKYGLVANADSARNLFIDVGYNGTNSAAVHEASSALNKLVWEKVTKQATNHNAVILSGGSGSAKTSLAKDFVESFDSNTAVLDGNLSSLSSAEKAIEVALKAGKIPNLVYVYREPIDSFFGTIKRTLTNSSEKGRVVPISVVASNHPGSLDVIKQLYEKYKPYIDQGKINFTFIDNSLGMGNAKKITFDEIKNITIPSDIKEQMLKAAQNIKTNGLIYNGRVYKLTDEQYNKIIQ